MFIISINSKDGKSVVPPFCVKSLSGIGSLSVSCSDKGLVLIVDRIPFFEECLDAVELLDSSAYEK